MLKIIGTFIQLGLMAILVALLINIVNPRFLWNKLESWKATSEPSPAFFASRRITSIIGALILLIILIGPRIMYYFSK